jgi:hypothetical protein
MMMIDDDSNSRHEVTTEGHLNNIIRGFPGILGEEAPIFYVLPSHLSPLSTQQVDSVMAPNLAACKHQMIDAMILHGTLKQAQMANAARCSERGI